MKQKTLLSEHKNVLAEYGVHDMLLQGVRILEFEKDEILCMCGQPVQDLLIVIKGRAKVTCDIENGKSLLLCIYNEKGILGDLEIINLFPTYTMNVQATTLVQCIAIPCTNGNLNKLLESNAFLLRICKELAGKLNRCTKNSTCNILYPLEVRLCSYITLTQRKNIWSENLSEVSELLGTSYRHLLRIVGQLCQEKLIRKQGHEYVILQKEIIRQRSKDFYQPAE